MSVQRCRTCATVEAGALHIIDAVYVPVVPLTAVSSALGSRPNLTYGVVAVPVTYTTAISSSFSVSAMWPCVGQPRLSAMGTVTVATALPLLTYTNLGR